jgi:mannose-6-phosphate isomerase
MQPPTFGPARLDGVVRHYAWGSPDALPRLLGREPDGSPWAELWFGAHEGDPSPLPDAGTTLADVIARDPSGVLGEPTVERFGRQLPFLLKLLAADTPLSIQVHPSRRQAEAGFDAEEQRGPARDAPDRNYRDRNHKPELLCALTPFEALCGFRPVADTVAVLERSGIAELRALIEALHAEKPLRAAFTAAVESEPSVVAAVSAAASPEGPLRPAWLASRHFPGDVGVVVSLLLNHVRLDPGQAIYLGAGNVHAYLQGVGVEIMAASDNVLRAGLTTKHVDVAELQRVTDFRELADPLRDPGADGFEVPVPDFRLQPVEVAGPVAVAIDGPAIALCTCGAVSAAGIELAPGRAVFVPGRALRVQLDGSGTAFVATVGRDQAVGTQ